MRCTKRTWGDSREYEIHKKERKKRYCGKKPAFSVHTKGMKILIVSKNSIISNTSGIEGSVYTKTKKKTKQQLYSEIKLLTDLGSLTD